MNANFFMSQWRLVTLYIGTAILCVGADYYQMPDWDAGVSILMALLCYVTAPWVVDVIYRAQWKLIPLAMLVTWVTVDYSYIMYNIALDREYFREANFYASLPLYLLMGMFWRFGEEVLTTFRAQLDRLPCI